MTNHIITSELLEEDPGLIDLIDRFISRLPDVRDAIIKAYTAEDWENFSGLIHQMKGVGGGYGYPMLTELCADIEVMVKEKNFPKVKIQLDEFNLMGEKILAGSDENHKIASRLL